MNVAPEAPEEELDPLDAFMMQNTKKLKKAQKKSEEKARRIEALKAAGQYVEERDDDEEEDDYRLSQEVMKFNNTQCWVCKEIGHSQENCPNLICHECNQKGHKQSECPQYTAKLKEKSNAKRRERNKKQKKAKRREEHEAHLREQTGIAGYQALYVILGLPLLKLASKAQITKAYRALALKYHPDRTAHLEEEEREAATAKFNEAKVAYDLLLEGMETGGKGMKGAVYSAGELTM